MKKLLNYIIYTQLLIYSYTPLYSQWSTDPNNNLIVGYGLFPEIASDSAGGCYITYEQNLGYPRRLILERLNRYGYKPWGSGKRILGELPEQSSAKIVEDGEHGVIISYQDYYWGGMSGPWISRLRVQRVDSSGNFLWGPTGVRVSISETNQGNTAIVSDGAGGCIVAWRDTLNTLRIQRVDVTGTRTWGDSGVYLYDDGGGPPVMIPDLSGGVVMSWRYEKLQRVNRLGQKVWTDTGITVSGGAGQLRIERGRQIYLRGRKFIGTINGELQFTVSMNKIDTSGVVHWGSTGVILDTAITNNFPLTDFTVHNGYSTIAWPQNIGGVWDLRTQIVRSDGSTVFEYGGRPLRNIVSLKGITGLVPSDSATTVFVWTDNRTLPGIYSQRLDTLGIARWDTNDIALCHISLGGLNLTSDGNGGCILVGWRETDFTVRAQQVSRNGRLGEIITSIDFSSTSELPKEFILHQNYPNPFNSSAVILYSVPRNSFVRIEIYNLLGLQVKTLVYENHQPGEYRIRFEAIDLPSGVYFYKLHTNEMILVRKLTIIK